MRPRSFGSSRANSTSAGEQKTRNTALSPGRRTRRASAMTASTHAAAALGGASPITASNVPSSNGRSVQSPSMALRLSESPGQTPAIIRGELSIAVRLRPRTESSGVTPRRRTRPSCPAMAERVFATSPGEGRSGDLSLWNTPANWRHSGGDDGADKGAEAGMASVIADCGSDCKSARFSRWARSPNR